MTTFTRMLLNPNKRSGRKLLLDPQSMHAAVRGAFPPDLDPSQGRVLWRVDSHGHEHVLYVVGPEAPDMTRIMGQAGWPTRLPETADYDRMLKRLQTGQEWGFRLRGNPVQSKKVDPTHGVRGRVVPHVSVRYQLEWLSKKADQSGFELIRQDAADPESELARVTSRNTLDFRRRDPNLERVGRVTISAVEFEGALRITDAQLLRSALVQGIGRSKAYGCGLLTLARRASTS